MREEEIRDIANAANLEWWSNSEKGMAQEQLGSLPDHIAHRIFESLQKRAGTP